MDLEFVKLFGTAPPSSLSHFFHLGPTYKGQIKKIMGSSQGQALPRPAPCPQRPGRSEQAMVAGRTGRSLSGDAQTGRNRGVERSRRTRAGSGAGDGRQRRQSSRPCLPLPRAPEEQGTSSDGSASALGRRAGRWRCERCGAGAGRW